MSKYSFIPFEFPTSPDGEYVIGLDEKGILRSRREQLGMTQLEVAERSGIKLPQYQRIEAGDRQLSGCSMRIGLAICAVLLLDPYEQVAVIANPPDPATMKPQRKINVWKASERSNNQSLD